MGKLDVFIAQAPVDMAPKLLEKSLAAGRSEIFHTSGSERLLIMREILNKVTLGTRLKIIRQSKDDVKDVVLCDKDLKKIDLLGSSDSVTLVPDKELSKEGNRNGYSYIYREIIIGKEKVGKVFVKVQTPSGQTGYVAIEHIEKPPTETPQPQKPDTINKTKEKTDFSITSVNGFEVVKNYPYMDELMEIVLFYEGTDGGPGDMGGGIDRGAGEKEYAIDGITLDKKGMIPRDKVKEAVRRMLECRIAYTIKTCSEYRVNFKTLPKFAQIILVDVCYNMGPRVHEFQKFWKAVVKAQNSGDWSEASKQLIVDGEGDGPSGYVIDVGGRAYANARGLKEGRIDKLKLWKISVQILSAYNIKRKYFDKTSDYGGNIGPGDKQEILEKATTVELFIEMITSLDALDSRGIFKGFFSDKGSTRAIIDLINDYRELHPGSEVDLKNQLMIKFGKFEHSIFENRSEMGAYQAWYYLEYGADAFKKNMKYIDGTYGGRIYTTFTKDFYKYRGKTILQGISTSEDVTKLGPFERQILLANLPEETKDVGEGPDSEKIRLASILENLEGNIIPISRTWNPKILGNSLEHFNNRERAIRIIRRNFDFKGSEESELPSLDSKLLFIIADFAKKFPKGSSQYNSGSDNIYFTELTRPKGLILSGGSKRSQHFDGKAADIRVNGKSDKAITAWTNYLENIPGLFFLRHTGTGDHIHIGLERE